MSTDFERLENIVPRSPANPVIVDYDLTTSSAGPITAEDCLKFVAEHAKTQFELNLMLIGAGILFAHRAGLFVEEKAQRRSRTGIATALVDAMVATKISRSIRYDIAHICMTVAVHNEAKPWVIEALKQRSLPAAVEYLKTKLLPFANVAELARHFGTERSSGRHRKHIYRHDSEPVTFLKSLRLLIEEADNQGEDISFVGAVNLLAPAVAERDLVDGINTLITKTPDDALPGLVNLIERMIEHRRGRR